MARGSVRSSAGAERKGAERRKNYGVIILRVWNGAADIMACDVPWAMGGRNGWKARAGCAKRCIFANGPNFNSQSSFDATVPLGYLRDLGGLARRKRTAEHRGNRPLATHCTTVRTRAARHAMSPAPRSPANAVFAET